MFSAGVRRSLRRRRAAGWILVACLAAAHAEPTAGAEAAGGADPETAAIVETLARLDALIAEFGERIEEARRRAEAVLERADAASDPEERMLLEELYGKMAIVAEGLDEQRSRLQAARGDLAAAGARTRP